MYLIVFSDGTVCQVPELNEEVESGARAGHCCIFRFRDGNFYELIAREWGLVCESSL